MEATGEEVKGARKTGRELSVTSEDKSNHEEPPAGQHVPDGRLVRPIKARNAPRRRFRYALFPEAAHARYRSCLIRVLPLIPQTVFNLPPASALQPALPHRR